jgi:hypothetical protein
MLKSLKYDLDAFVNLAVEEPALLMTVLQTILAVIASLGLGLAASWTGGILTFASAALAAIPGFLARPVKASAITGLVSAGVTALIAFGVHGIQPGLIAALNAAVVAIMAIVLRGHLTTLATSAREAKARQAAVVQPPVTPPAQPAG